MDFKPSRTDFDLFDLVSEVQSQMVQKSEEEALVQGILLAQKQSHENGKKSGREVQIPIPRILFFKKMALELGSYLGMLEGILKFKDFILEFKEAYKEDIEKINRSIMEINGQNCNAEDFESSIQKIRDQMKVNFFENPRTSF